MKSNVASFFIAVVVALILLGCASTGVRPVSELKEPSKISTRKIEPEARTVFFQAERAFIAHKYDKARHGFLTVRARYPRATQANMMATYRLGSIHYYLEEYEAASKEFLSFLGSYPNSDLGFDVRYNLAASEYQLGNYQKANQVLSTFHHSAVRAEGPRRAEIVFQLMALCAESTKSYPRAVSAYAAQAQLPITAAKKASIYEKAESDLAYVIDRSELEQILGEVSEPTVRNLITMRLNAIGGAQAAVIPMENVSRPEISAGLPLVAGTMGDRFNVGVILPLSGEFAAYGQRALEGIVLASRSFHERRENDFHLMIEDSESNPEIAAGAVDKLFHQHGVMAIIGPLNWKESLAVADRSQQLGVLNLSLNGKEGISARGAYLFQNALTPRVQLDSLVSYCVENKNYRRFAIFAPNDNFGKDMAYQFWDLADKKGAKIVAFKTYPPKEKDFQNPISEMIGVANIKYRRMEWERLQQFVTEQKQKSRREVKAQLPPIVDFDALFIPDSPAVASQIAASLAYFDATGFPLLGTTEWNSEQLYQRGGRLVEGALFPGALSVNTDNQHQKEFVGSFTSAYGSAPDLLASQAYEAMYLVGAVIKESGNANRNAIVTRLRALENFPTPLGNITFDDTRIARRKLPIFKLEKNGQIVRQP